MQKFKSNLTKIEESLIDGPTLMNSIVDFIRTDIGRFCFKCHSKCCSVGKIIISKEELSHFTIKKYEKRTDGQFEILLKQGGCPELRSDSKCNIYQNRPQICREYPIFEHSKLILVSELCPYIHEYNSEINKLKELGFRVEFI